MSSPYSTQHCTFKTWIRHFDSVRHISLLQKSATFALKGYDVK
nr:MAG TPA: hypothetical protein [Caudoviricetes sp.]